MIGPTAGASQAIAWALANGMTVQLMAGATYILSEPIRLPSGATLLGDPTSPPVLVPSASSPASNPDDPLNAMLFGWAESLAQTELVSRSLKGTHRLQVADPSLFAAGDWVRIAGPNAGSDSAGVLDGSAVIKREVAEVAAVYDTTLELAVPTAQTHGVGSRVERIEPLVDVLIRNVALDASAQSFATGLYLADAVAFDLSVETRSFSRSGVELVGSRDGSVDAIGRGACNSIVFLSSVADTDLRVDSSSGSERFHSAGIPRGLVTMRHRCSGVVLADSRLEGGCTGVSIWGGTGITIRDCDIRDMRFHERALRDPEIPRVASGEARSAAGIEVDGFMSPSENTEYGFGLAIRDVRIEDCRHPGSDYQSSVLIVDQESLAIDGLAIMNFGYASSTANDFMGGLALVDVFNGTIDNLSIRGVATPLRFQGGWVRCDFGSVHIEMVDGRGDNYGASIYLECGSSVSQPTRIHFADLNVHVTVEVLHTGHDFVPHTATGVTIGRLRAEQREYADVVVGRSMSTTAFAAGAVAQLGAGPDIAAGLHVPTSDVAHDKVIIVNGTGLGLCSGSTWLLASRGPIRSVRIPPQMAVQAGDTICVDPMSGALTVGTGPSLGTALASRPAGSTNLVPVG